MGGAWRYWAGEIASLVAGLKADSPLRRIGRGLQQRQQLAVDIAQCGIVPEQGTVDLGKAFENGGIGHELLPHPGEGADDVNAHGYGLGAAEHHCRHDRAVFRERIRRIFHVPAAL